MKDRSGKVFENGKDIQDNGTIDLIGNAAGIYIIRATLEDGSTETHRAVLAPQ